METENNTGVTSAQLVDGEAMALQATKVTHEDAETEALHLEVVMMTATISTDKVESI
jgi:hypothetical protein